MSDGEIAEPLRGGMAHVVPFPAAPNRVTFSRDELRSILDLYGRKVAEGEWRDYAIDFTRDKAVFCIYRRTSEGFAVGGIRIAPSRRMVSPFR